MSQDPAAKPSKSTYKKNWLSIESQLQKLESYGLQIADREMAQSFLHHANYYRFAGYCLAFEESRHKFHQGVTFDQVRYAYDFDARLRDLFSQALQWIEIDLCASTAHYFGEKYGAFGHIEADNFTTKFGNEKHTRRPLYHADWLTALREEAGRSQEIFVDHFRDEYIEFPDLPIWTVTEVMTFGRLARMIRGMKRIDRKCIGYDLYGIPEPVFFSLVHHLHYVRNRCAHHSRLWDRTWKVSSVLPQHSDWKHPQIQSKKRVFTTLLLMKQLLDSCNALKSNMRLWQDQVNELMAALPDAPKAGILIGLSKDWKQHPVWIQE